jgi:diadenosine tetraphosphate (Ap4A) HIT family hydrolase
MNNRNNESNKNKIYENDLVFVEIEPSQIPWLKIFTKDGSSEFSQCSSETKLEIFRLLDIIEKGMLDFYKPKKINIASFGNYLPKVHFHIMARFEDDDYFPEPMWGKKQRENELKIEGINEFIKAIKLEEYL